MTTRFLSSRLKTSERGSNHRRDCESCDRSCRQAIGCRTEAHQPTAWHRCSAPLVGDRVVRVDRRRGHRRSTGHVRTMPDVRRSHRGPRIDRDGPSADLRRSGLGRVERQADAGEQHVDVDPLGALLARPVPGVDAVEDARRLPRVERAVVRQVRTGRHRSSPRTARSGRHDSGSRAAPSAGRRRRPRHRPVRPRR